MGPVYQTVKSHNKTLIARIAAAKKTADSTRFKWGKFMELLSTVDGLDDKLKSDPEITKKFLLSAISHFHQENKDLIEINAARTIMNNNAVKVEVLKEILGYKQAENNLGGLGISKTAPIQEDSDTFNLKDQVEQEELDQLEEELRNLHDEESALDSELRGVESRNLGAERELRKNRDAIEEMQAAIRQEDSIAQRIKEIKSKLAAA